MRLSSGRLPAQCREQHDAAIAILDVGWTNDSGQQQTQRAEFLSPTAPEFGTEAGYQSAEWLTL